MASDKSADTKAIAPGQGSDDIFEDLRPASGLRSPKVFVADHHNATTRRGLAITIFSVVGAMYLAGFVGVFSHFLSVDDFIKIIGALAGPQTLAAAVVGFYFAKDK
jgi:hypothetical protein